MSLQTGAFQVLAALYTMAVDIAARCHDRRQRTQIKPVGALRVDTG
jgi:hypothetical protein